MPLCKVAYELLSAEVNLDNVQALRGSRRACQGTAQELSEALSVWVRGRETKLIIQNVGQVGGKGRGDTGVWCVSPSLGRLGWLVFLIWKVEGVHLQADSCCHMLVIMARQPTLGNPSWNYYCLLTSPFCFRDEFVSVHAVASLMVATLFVPASKEGSACVRLIDAAFLVCLTSACSSSCFSGSFGNLSCYRLP